MKVKKTKYVSPAITLSIAILVGIVSLSSNIHAVTTQSSPSKSADGKTVVLANTPPPTPALNKTSAAKPVLPILVFQGHSIKIFTVTDFLANQWQPIDNLTSHGYDLKAIIPRQNANGHVNAFTVVLGAKP
jgi:hypothetical protein